MSRRAAAEAHDHSEIPEPDRVPGAPHPRQTLRLFGQERAERGFLDAWGAGRLHHGWLLRGPQGVGKATLAYRIARALIAHDPGAPPPNGLDMPTDHPVVRRIAAGAEPRLRAVVRPLRRKPGSRAFVEPLQRAAEITVGEIRELGEFLHLSAADGGWRAVVVDAADELNVAAANALLKLLEEPPARCVLLLVAHAPGRLPPTIRSRCRTLDLHPLPPDAFAAALAQAGAATAASEALAELSRGAPGDALAMAAEDGPALYAELAALASGAPGLDRRRLRALAASCAGREAAGRYSLAVRFSVLLLQRLARAGAGAPLTEAAPREAEIARALSSDPARARLWAELAAQIEASAAQARAVNLDPEQTILDIWLRVDAAAGRAARAPASSSP
ncbi:MAG: DNA polymerase III subunit delta' [Rubrimonas sp.]|uniref:DNA polymerase III subunit delta' n=1 Tax=Rubrimonas sp. TaxID=2036015 RepID=UPI002FDD1C18